MIGSNSRKKLDELATGIYSTNYTDFTKGDDYKNLKERYQKSGQRAMDDTIGQVSARTGGIASSYATAAGNQAYNEHMSKLEDAARAMYDDQRQEKIDNFNVQRSLYDIDYQATRDRVADSKWNAERLTEQERWNQSRADDLLDREISSLGDELYYAPDAYGSYEAYKKANPDSKLTEAQYNQILNTSKGAYTEANKADEEERLWNNAITMWTTGNAVDAETIKALGLTPAQAAAYASYYQAQNQPKLDLSLDQVIEQLEGGNFGASVLNAYEQETGEPYVNVILRNRQYTALTADDVTALGAYMEAKGEDGAAIADRLVDEWEYYMGDGEYALTKKEYKFVDPKDNKVTADSDAMVEDARGNQYSVAELVEMLKADDLTEEQAVKQLDKIIK
jgi:hypothetical protein